MPTDIQLKILLVEGWQNYKLNSYAYPLSCWDHKFLNQTYDLLYKQGQIDWVFNPILIYPVFIVWRMVHGMDKGCIIVDLQALNQVAVPDSYPLLLQGEVIASIYGKYFILVINAIAFFYQFLVYPDY